MARHRCLELPRNSAIRCRGYGPHSRPGDPRRGDGPCLRAYALADRRVGRRLSGHVGWHERMTYNAPDREFTRIGPGLNAWNMKSRGWLDESRVWSGSGHAGDTTIKLRPHVRRDLPGLLAAEL